MDIQAHHALADVAAQHEGVAAVLATIRAAADAADAALVTSPPDIQAAQFHLITIRLALPPIGVSK